jgi:signal transduction histidine kinase
MGPSWSAVTSAGSDRCCSTCCPTPPTSAGPTCPSSSPSATWATRAELEVRDHGDGVAPADVERVFQRFTRLAPDQQGLGLGLFVSRGIARAHGGDLTAEAAEDAGSRFRLTLPPAGGD